MEKNNIAGRVTRDVLLDTPLPQATKTYTVLSHKFIIDTIKDRLAKKGFVVIDEIYGATHNGQIAYGAFHINYGNDPELGMLFAFNNSYNKQLKFSCSVGAYVKSNKTSILSKDGSAWVRMHTGKAKEETIATIEKQVDNAEHYFRQLAADKNAMMNVPISRREFGELLGRLYVDAKLLGSTQTSIAKQEYEKPSFTYAAEPDSLWVAYNHILIALAKSHPRTWMAQQKLVHFHMITEFDFTVFDEEDAVDPNQTSLIDLVAQVEDAGVDHVSELPVEVPSQDEIDSGVAYEEVETLTADDIEEAVDLPLPKPDMPETVYMTRKEILEKYGYFLDEAELKAKGVQEIPDILPNEVEEAPEPVAIAEPVEEKPKPSITRREAVEKYGHLISDEEAALALKGKSSPESLQILKDAYLADQAKAEKTEEKIEEVVDLDAEEDSDWEKLQQAGAIKEVVTEGAEAMMQGEPTSMKEVGMEEQQAAEQEPPMKHAAVEGTLNEKEPTILGADSAEEEAKVREVLEESGLAKPTVDLSELEGEYTAEEIPAVIEKIEEKVEMTLPQAPGKTETPEGASDVVESDVVTEVAADFFMTQSDLMEINPEIVLEVGVVITIGDEDCEIVSVGEDVGLCSICEVEPVEEEADEIEVVAEEPDMAFSIGAPDEMPAAETMLRTQVEVKEEPAISEEEAASIEEAIGIMNSKVELSPAEQATKDAIEKEIIDLYGTASAFTFKQNGDQYTVNLESGESFILTTEYIDSLKEE